MSGLVLMKFPAFLEIAVIIILSVDNPSVHRKNALQMLMFSPFADLRLYNLVTIFNRNPSVNLRGLASD